MALCISYPSCNSITCFLITDFQMEKFIIGNRYFLNSFKSNFYLECKINYSSYLPIDWLCPAVMRMKINYFPQWFLAFEILLVTIDILVPKFKVLGLQRFKINFSLSRKLLIKAKDYFIHLYHSDNKSIILLQSMEHVGIELLANCLLTKIIVSH